MRARKQEKVKASAGTGMVMTTQVQDIVDKAAGEQKTNRPTTTGKDS